MLQQELLAGMQLSAEYKAESLQPVHSKDELSPHAAVAGLHGCSANKLPAIASTSVPGIPLLPLQMALRQLLGRKSVYEKELSEPKEISI